MEFEAYVTREIGNFIWDGFTDPAGVGVNVVDILEGAAAVGLNFTSRQIDAVLAHGDDFGEWSFSDEVVKQAIADATDIRDYRKMLAWLAFVVGDTTAADLVKGWQEEARDIVSRFDRRNFNKDEDSVTLPVKVWRDMLKEDLKETEDPDDRDAIKATAALLDGEDSDALAIQYVMDDPADFKVLPSDANTRDELVLCRDLALN